jgi:putative colanic acid biosynthesis acetyltransferase WcaB
VELFTILRADWKANRHITKGRVLVTCFRVAQFFAPPHASAPLRAAGIPVTAAYRLLVGWIMGCELSERAQVGPGLVVYHGQGLVVSSETRIGYGCILRHNTTIGNAFEGGGSPVIGDRVEIGAHACIVGEITIGDGAIIGAGSVVVTSIPAGSLAVGNPARVVKRVWPKHSKPCREVGSERVASDGETGTPPARI